MPSLDFMVLAEYVRSDSGGMHIIGAGVDTLHLPAVPCARPLSLAIRITTDSSDTPGKEHTIAVIFQGEDGVLSTVNGRFIAPEKNPDIPIHWETGIAIVLGMGLPFPAYGDYSIELTIDGNHAKSINIRAVPVQASQP